VVLRNFFKKLPSLKVKVVKTPQEIRQGLMYVKKPLPRNTGILFDPGNETQQLLWMKNTFIPLDMIFLDQNHKILGFIENTQPLSTELLGINSISRYAIEVNGGWCQRNQIKIGDILQLGGLSP